MEILMKDLIHIPNLVPDQFADRLQNVIYSEAFSWRYSDNTAKSEEIFQHYINSFSGVADKIKDEGQMTSNIWHISAPQEVLLTKFLDLFSGLIFFMFDRVPESSIGEFNRVKANLTLKKPESWEGKIAEPHVDHKRPGFKSLLYYVDSADGDTIIYNERYNNVISKTPEELTERSRFTPKKGSAILFDSDIIHTHEYPLYTKNRAVINFCFSQTRDQMINEIEGEDRQNDLFE